MITIPGYQVLTQIYESSNSLVYRGIRELDNQSVIFKVLKQDYLTVNELTRYKQEYEITSSLNLEGIVKAYSLEPYQRTLIIIFEDFGGVSLAQLLNEQPLTLLEFLKITIQITEILSAIHRANIIHKDINPSNIVFNPATEQLKLIDFGISTVLSRENPTLKNPNVLEGTLPYMSPEQTGRMNRSLDYRTDFYSLGVTFYELLTNKLPFDTTDALELVHCHIAKQPTPPHQINPNIPQVVSDIVMKLLEKTAEERYQSAWGLKADLEECLIQMQFLGEVLDFTLARQDISDKFQIPQKLYGREREIETLLTSFERVVIGQREREEDEENEDIERGGEENPQFPASNTESKIQNSAHILQSKIEMMLISGYSGIGKSALVAEIYKPITQKRGYFISGKFDQYKRNIPYAAIVDAFQGLVRQLLTESEAQLQQWREKLLATLEPNGQVIIDVIPEVELIIGKQAAVPELTPAEAQNRFNLVFQNFIKVFTNPLHPLVIFLDDLQWADGASLKLIHMLMTSSDSQHLFLIGAYRDNEVSTAHPLMITLKEIKEAEVVVNEIFLKPLELSTVNQLISDTLKFSTDITLSLSRLVLEKTGGNPFFLIEFLKSLYTDGLLNFIPPQSLLSKKSSKEGWEWNLDKIRLASITDNVVELMALKIQKLPSSTQRVLKLAACIGNQFELETLALVDEQSLRETATSLHAAVAEGLILPLGDAYKSIELDVPQSSNNLTVEYKFVHDRIQQAAYSLIPDESRQLMHRQVGQLLLQNTPLDKREEKIFDIVNQLNLGLAFINHQSERNELAQLNLIASKKAKAATAYEPSFKYLLVGLALLEVQHWQTQYELALALYIEAAEVAYLYGNFEEMERLAEVVLQQAKTVLDKVKVYEVRIQAYIAQDKPKEAVSTALTVLKLLEINLPKEPRRFQIAIALWQTKLALVGKPIEDLINLPQMTNPIKLAAMRILCSVISAASFSSPKLFPLIALKALNLSLKYGNTSLSTYAYATYGQILSGVVGNIDAGYQFGQLALALLSQLNARELKAKVLLVVNDFIIHWREHVRETLDPFVEAYKGGLETGDLEFTARSAMVYSYHSYFIGKELTSLEQEIKNYSDIIKQLKQTKFIYMNERYRQVVLNLMGKTENPCRLVGEAYDEEILLPLHIQSNDRNAIFNVYLHKAILCYTFQDYLEAFENIRKAEKYLDNATGLLLVPIYYFYNSLIKLSVLTHSFAFKPKVLLKKVLANQRKLKKWSSYAPMNHLHKFYLVEAEVHHFLGQDTQAMENYDRAISLAKDNGYLNEEALAHELAARFYLAKGKAKIAQVYMQDAYYCYLTWGATAKTKDLAQRYPQLIASSSIRVQGKTTAPLGTRNSSGEVSGEVLDLATVMKASQTIYEDIVLEKLLVNLMKILIENAGAEKGFLILETKGKLLIEAEGVVGSDQVTVLQSIPVENNQFVSATIINYVARTRESVVLNNATQEGKFTNDSYIKKHQPKSILCNPLINQGKLSGIVYLENNLILGAFTPDRIQVLNMLSVQAAISIKNSRFYNQLAELNKAYERFVPRQFLQFLDKESIVDVQLGDQVQQEMSILFADIRAFTSLSETLTPQDNFKFINAYLSRMESVIIENQGFIDKYIGDAIMALFSGEADNAVKAGIAMLHRLTDYNQHRINSGYIPIKIGIGINTGSLMLGTVGGQNRMDGTVISDAVNLASRLETLTKNYGVSLLISHQTLARLQNPMEYNLRFIEQVKVKGKSKAIAVFEVFDGDEPEIKESKLATKACFEEGLFLYHQHAFPEAAQCFEAVLSLNPRDTVAQVYQSRCRLEAV